ncbi:thioredoxin family protein [Brevifollis gellanilyticus]|nr:thioredoxin family protein [Brevifollis gellanilyticus]
MIDTSLPTGPSSRSENGGSLLWTLNTSKVPVLVEFYADWCPPCKKVSPLVEEFSREIGTKARVVRINIDDQPGASNQHAVRSIPTFITFKDGREIRREVGAIPKRVMEDMLDL